MTVVPIKALIIEFDESTALSLSKLLSRHPLVVDVLRSSSALGSEDFVKAEGVNAIFVNPVSAGIKQAASLFDIRAFAPYVAIAILYDEAQIRPVQHDFSQEFFYGTKKRFRHYVRLELRKCTPFSEEAVHLALDECEAYISINPPPDHVMRLMNELKEKRTQAGQVKCFISYSSKDDAFARRIHEDLEHSGFECWFAPHDLPIGAKIRKGIDEAIGSHHKLILILSRNSIASAWVEKEVETAFEKEARDKTLVFIPIRLDNAVMETDEAWAADIRRQRNIGDFSGWENDAQYRKALKRLVHDLRRS